MKIRFTTAIISFASICFVMFAGTVHAVQAPSVLHYQARVYTIDGRPFDGTLAVQAFVYDSPDAGATGDTEDPHVLFAEDYGQREVDRGMLKMEIGAGTPIGRFSGTSLSMEALASAGTLYIELYLNGQKLAPRQVVAYQNAAHTAQYAKVARDLTETFHLSQSNLPDNISAGKVISDTLNVERIPDLPSNKFKAGERFSSSRIPTNIPLSRISGTLKQDVIPAFSADKLVIGTEGETLQGSQMPPIVMREGEIGFAMGILDNGAAVSAVPGFDLSTECKWIVAYWNDSEAIDMGDGIDNFQIFSGTAEDPTVTCILSQNGGATTYCKVSYLMLCKKNPA